MVFTNKTAKVSGKLRQLLELTQGNEKGKVFFYTLTDNDCLESQGESLISLSKVSVNEKGKKK